MIRDAMLEISETLFYVMAGEPLMNTVWIFVWIAVWCTIMVLPMFYVFNVRSSSMAKLAFLIVFFPGLLMAIGPGIVQTQMLSECRTVAATVTTDQATETVDLRQCRHKDNYYGEFGEWKTFTQR